MSLKPFPQLQALRPQQMRSSDVTLKDFSGGLFPVKSDVALSNNYAEVSKNFIRNEDGSLSLRYGVEKQHTLSKEVIHIADFQDTQVFFLENGEVVYYNLVTEQLETIWDESIANALPDEPEGWSDELRRISTTIFRSELIAQNGVDKPIIIKEDFTVDYLQDVVNGTNIHTPIGKYITTANNFCVVADVVDDVDLFISSAGTSGVWPGDEEPNNSTVFSLGTWVSSSTAKYTGLVSWQDHVFVFFEEAVIVVRLGEFDDEGNHKPRVVRSFSSIGALSDKAILPLEKTLVFVSSQGLHRATIESFTKEFVIERVNNPYEEKLLQAIVNKPPGCASCQLKQMPAVKMVLLQLYQFIGPPKTFCINHNATFSQTTWGEFIDWEWRIIHKTKQNRLMFSKDEDVFIYGNDLHDNEIILDDDGEAISFDYETPWLDANARMKTKKLIRALLDARGTAQFTLEVYVDRFYRNKETNKRTPALAMDFRGGEALGYGADEGTYSARRTRDERFLGMPARFRLLKLRITGSTKQPLTLSAISLLFREGGFNR